MTKKEKNGGVFYEEISEARGDQLMSELFDLFDIKRSEREVAKSWIVGHEMIVLCRNGQYKIGNTTNVFGFGNISSEEAEKKLLS